MSRLGYITGELAKSAEEGRDASLSEADVKWAVHWERWDLLEAAGYDVGEVRERYGAGSNPAETDPYNTAGVPRGGANDRAMELDPETGQPRTVVDGDDGDGDGDGDEMPEDYNDWKVDQLRAELKGRQLPADGNKADLVARLEADDEAAEEG